MPFSLLSLAKPLLTALHEEGYTKPTPIQAKAIPAIMEGRDVLGCAQTGTGKTAAFALPILHRLVSAPTDKSHRGPVLPRALILSPTRELANQIGESFATYGRHTGLTHTCVYGGMSQFHQVKALNRGVDILVATPGRLEDLMEQGLVNLSEVKVFVLDEADRMLDMGFIQPIRRIAAALPEDPKHRRQTLLFSATMPKEIMHLADSLLHDPVKVAVAPVTSTAPLISQSLYMVPKLSKQSLLKRLLEDKAVTRAVVFTKTKHGADRVSRKLRTAGVTAGEIHGNKAQNQRQRALEAFRNGRMRVLVATDVAARGLDVDGITHVFNYDLPMEPENYIHRIGRTGRAGATGVAVSFCDGSERDLLRDIEKMTGKKIPLVATPSDLEKEVPGGAAHPDDAESFRAEPSSRGHAPSRGGHARDHRDARPQPQRREARPHSGAHAAPAHRPKPVHTTHAAPAHPHTPKHAPASSHPERSHTPAHKPTPSANHARGSLTDPIPPKAAKSYDYDALPRTRPHASAPAGGHKPHPKPAHGHAHSKPASKHGANHSPRPADKHPEKRGESRGGHKGGSHSGRTPHPLARRDSAKGGMFSKWSKPGGKRRR